LLEDLKISFLSRLTICLVFQRTVLYFLKLSSILVKMSSISKIWSLYTGEDGLKWRAKKNVDTKIVLKKCKIGVEIFFVFYVSKKYLVTLFLSCNFFPITCFQGWICQANNQKSIVAPNISQLLVTKHKRDNIRETLDTSSKKCLNIIVNESFSISKWNQRSYCHWKCEEQKMKFV